MNIERSYFAHIKGIKEYFKLQILVCLLNDYHGEVIS